MKCLRKYRWLKLQRACLPQGRGILGYWSKLASRAAFRKGIGLYCGHHNAVIPGMWKGGIVGLKKILGIKRRQRVLWIMHELEDLGLIKFTLDERTRKMTYEILDWVPLCSGPDITDGNVYATEGFGFFGVPRNITERLIDNEREFDDADAWLDLWCHTVYRDYGNAFSFLGAAVQFGKYGSVQTLEGLGKRWHWEKTKVWRFFQKNKKHPFYPYLDPSVPDVFRYLPPCMIVTSKYDRLRHYSTKMMEAIRRNGGKCILNDCGDNPKLLHAFSVMNPECSNA